MIRLVGLASVAAAATLPVVQAATCSQSQVQSIYGLYQSAAKRSGCAPYSSVAAGTGAVNIQYTCTTTSCLPTMEQLARQLPDCELPSTGVNQKKQLEYGLYTQCKICTDTQDAQITALWQAAAKTSACDEYARSSSFSTSFSWPCSASSCTAVLEDLAGKVPDCFTGSVNEKNRILKAVSTCKSTSLVKTPAPVTTSTGVSSAPATTPPPRPPSSAGSSGGTGSNSDACSESQTKESAALWEAAAKTSACSSYATVTASQVFIRWPCSSSSCTSVMETLRDKLPSCVLPGSTKSEKATLQSSVKTCRSGGGSTNNNDSQKEEGGGSNSASTPTPTPTPSFSSTTCTTTQVKGMVSQYVATATGSECKAYSTVTSFRVSIYAPCSSSCVTKSLQTLASGVPDCYYSYDAENKKKQLLKALAICSGDSRSRELRTAASSSSSSSTSSSSGKYVSLSFGSSSTIDASASVTAAPPAVSRASRVGGTQQSWLVSVVVTCVASVTLIWTV